MRWNTRVKVKVGTDCRISCVCKGVVWKRVTVHHRVSGLNIAGWTGELIGRGVEGHHRGQGVGLDTDFRTCLALKGEVCRRVPTGCLATYISC